MARAGKYWVIVSGGAPTSFRGPDRELLEPTLRQLQRTQPDAAIKWFDGAKFFESRDEAIEWAKKCPAAQFGTIEVRPIWPTGRQ